jgi:hypothetical protein
MQKTKDMKKMATLVRELFEQHLGHFDARDFVDMAGEMGFALQPLAEQDEAKYTYHATQQPGEGFWAAAPGVGDISEGMVWVSTEKK